MFNTATTLKALNLCLALMVIQRPSEGLPSLGTKNGFDVGGNESVCLVSELGSDNDLSRENGTTPEATSSVLSLLGNITSAENNSDTEAETAATTLIESLNNALFAQKPARRGLDLTTRVELNREKVELLSECFNGTFAQVTALDLEPNAGLYVEVPYTFRVSMGMNISGMSSSAALFIRFFMCDALQQGFCNPVIQSPVENGSSVVLVSESTDTPLLALHDPNRNQIISPWALPLTTVIDTEAAVLRLENLNLRFQIPGTVQRGLYRFVMHAMLALLDDDGSTSSVKRVDTATLGDVSVVNIQDEPNILEVSKGLKVVIFILISVYDTIIAVMIAYLFRFRNHKAIKLAQGPFLGALLVAALIGGTFTFTFMPERDAYCIMRGPLVLFPFTVIGAIIVARLWRIYVTLSGAMSLGRSGAKNNRSSVGRSALSVRFSQFVSVGSWNFLQRTVSFLSFFAKMPLIPRCMVSKERRTKRKTSNFRKTATGGESAQLVCFLVLPQAILQTVGNAVLTPTLELDMDDNGRTGRYFCGEPDEKWDWIQFSGFFLCAIIFLLAVLLAWQGRELPSVFNEKDAIFQIATISALVLILNLVVIEVTDKEASSPDSSVFLRTITFLGIATMIVLNLVYPKIKRAQSGEKVVVGNLLRAYGEPSESVDNTSQVGSGGSPGAIASTYISGAPIVLKQDDPLPRAIEVQIHQMHILFRGIGDKCASGIPMSKMEWQQLNRSVAKLKTELDRVTLKDWDGGSSSGYQRSTSSSGADSSTGENISSHNALSSSSNASPALYGNAIEKEDEGELAPPQPDNADSKPMVDGAFPDSLESLPKPATNNNNNNIGSADLLLESNRTDARDFVVGPKQKLKVSFDDRASG